MKWRAVRGLSVFKMLVAIVLFGLLVALAPAVALADAPYADRCPAPPTTVVTDQLRKVPELSVIAGLMGLPEDMVASDNVQWNCRYGWLHGITNWDDQGGFRQRLIEYAKENGVAVPFNSSDSEAPVTPTYKQLMPVYARMHGRQLE